MLTLSPCVLIEISEAVTRGSTDAVKGVKRKKIVTENHLTKIPKSPLRTPSQAKPKGKIEDPLSSSNILPDTSELIKEQHSLATQNGKQSKQTEGSFSREVAIKTSKSETSVPTKLCFLPQSLDLNKWPVEDCSSAQLVKKGVASSLSSTVKIDNNECINFVNCNNSSSCTNTAFDVLLKAMEPELNTLAQEECPSSGMQIEKLRPNRTVNASRSLTSNTQCVQSPSLLQQEFVAGSQLYPCTSQTVHVATSGKSEQAQTHLVAHSKEQLLAKAGQQSQPIIACSSFTSSLVHQQNQENLKLQHIFSIAVTSSIINPPSSTVTQVFSKNQLVAKSSPLPVHSPNPNTQLPIAPLYNSAQIASVVSHGVEQICNLLKDQKPKKMGKYVCEYCNRACAKPSVLLKHIRSHTGERPYPCETCGFSFKTKSNLYKHKKSHAHAIKLGLVLQPDSSSLFLSHESDKALSIHSDVEESGDSDDEGTPDDQGSLELEPAHVEKLLSNSEPLHKGNSILLNNPEYILRDSSLQESATQARTALPKVIVHPVNVSPLRSDSPKIADPISTFSTTQQGDLKTTDVKANVIPRELPKELDPKQYQKTETSISEEQHVVPVGTVHAQLQRQQATDCSQDEQGKCLLSPRSLGSTDSGYFSRSESADQNMSPSTPFIKGLPSSEKDPSKSLPCVPQISTTVASIVQTTGADKSLLLSGQMRPPLATKTLEERISKLISDNEAVVDDKQLDSVKPRRTSLSRRGSIDSPKSYIFKDSFQFDLKPMGRRTSSSSDIPKSPFTPTEKSKQVFLLSVPTLDCLPITRSNSMPTTSYSSVPPNVIPPPHPLRGSQSFDDKIGSLYDDVFVAGPTPPQLQSGHPRTLVRQAAIEDSSISEGHSFGPARSVDESYGCNSSNEFVMARSKSFVQGSNLDTIKKSHPGRGTMFECETCRNRYRKLENFENHKKFYCSELHGPKTKAAIRDSEHKTGSNNTQPQILHYRVATSTGVWEQTSQIRKRRKMKSVGDDDDEPQATDTGSLSKSIAGSQCENKPGNTVSISKHTASSLGTRSISLQKLAKNVLDTHSTEQAMEPKLLLHGGKYAATVAQEKNELKRHGAGISVIQHTNSLSRPSSFEKSDSFERVSPVSYQDSTKAAKLHTLNTSMVQEEKRSLLSASHCHQVSEASRTQLHECQVSPNERNAPIQPLRLVRQHNIQVPEILVTEEPDRDQECQCSDQEKTEKFNWPQRSETLAKLPTEKLPPKKKRIRLAEIEHSSAESSFDSTLSRSLSRESSLSRASSFSTSFDKDDAAKGESPSKPDSSNKSLEFLGIPTGSNTLSVPRPHYREMRRAASEQIHYTQPSMEAADHRSKSFDCGSMSPPKPASLTEISTSKLSSGSGVIGHVPLLERRRGPLVRQISLNIAPEKNLPEIMSNASFQTVAAADISAVSFHRLQSSEKPPEEFPSSSQHPQPLSESQTAKSNSSLNLSASEQASGPSLHHTGQQPSLNQYSQTSLKGPALGTQLNVNMVTSQHGVQDGCFAPKYQLHVKALHVGQQRPIGLPGPAGTEAVGTLLEIPTKLSDKKSNPYVVPSLPRSIPDNCSGQMYRAMPFAVPVRIHSNIPSYGLATVAPLPQILVTRDQANESLSKTSAPSVPVLKDQAKLPKPHNDPLRCLPSSQPAPMSENLLYETGSKLAASLGPLNIHQVPVSGLFPQQEATASSKRMLSPANSLDIAMEKHQKRVKDESGAACMTGAMSLHPPNRKASELPKQKKPVLVRQICATEPLESFSSDQDVIPPEKSNRVSGASDMLTPSSSDSGISSFIKESSEHENISTSETVGFGARQSLEPTLLNVQNSFLKFVENSQESRPPGIAKDSRQPSIQVPEKSESPLAVLNASDTQRLPFPSLKTTTDFTWCYLLKRKSVHLLQNDQNISVYSSWPISPKNPNPLGLPTKVALSLLNSKQNAGKAFYTQAIMTNFKSDILVYSSKWKNNKLKVPELYIIDIIFKGGIISVYTRKKL